MIQCCIYFGSKSIHCYATQQYRYWVLVSLEANIIGYWILRALFGIVLTLLFTAYNVIMLFIVH